MIRDIDSAVHHTVEWIMRRAALSGASSLVVGISGGVDSAVVAGLCKRAGLDVTGVIMPCHSSKEAIDRAEEVVNKFNLTPVFVDLADAHKSIVSQVSGSVDVDDESKLVVGALRSCLRAPTLDFVAKARGGIVVGTGNRDEDEVTRYYQKRGDGAVDISPIAKFHKSEIYQLARFLEVPQSVIAATPSADLWGPDSGQADEKELGLSYNEVEWGMQFAQKYSRIPLELSNGNISAVHIYDALNMAQALDVHIDKRQETVLHTLAAMEEKSRHKANPNLPVFDARRVLGLDEVPVEA